MQGPLARLGATVVAGSRRGVRVPRRQYSTPVPRAAPRRQYSTPVPRAAPRRQYSTPAPRVAPSLRQHLASLDQGAPATPLTITAWVRSLRVHSKVAFLNVTDGSLQGRDTFQAVIKGDVMRELLPTLTLGAAVRLEGNVTSENGRAPELRVTSAAVVGPNDPETHPILSSSNASQPTTDLYRKNAHLRTVDPRQASILRIRSRLETAMSNYYNNHDFIRVNPPILTASDCEGGGEVFSVTDGKKEEESASEPAYLTVSSQLHLEAILLGLGRVYTFTPAFRAEDSATNRHLREFWMCEVEMVTCGGRQSSTSESPTAANDELDEVMNVVEDSIKFGLTSVLNESTTDLSTLYTPDSDHSHLLQSASSTTPWKRLTYTEALTHLKPQPKWGESLTSEQERYLSRNGPIFITDYPAATKPFYMRVGPNDTVRAFDLLIPGIGEVAGGSLREDNEETLVRRMKELKLLDKDAQSVPDTHPLYWYIVQLRKYAMPPHGGFGIGVERLCSWITRAESVRECLPFPRVGRKVRF